MDVRRIKNRRTAPRTRSLATLITLGFLLPNAWAAGPKINFNIPAGTLEKTILRFSDQARVETMYVSSEGTVAGVMTHAVVGLLEPAEALARMLKGTGVTFEFENARSVLLRRIPKPARVIKTRSDEAGPFIAVQHTFESEPEQEVVVTGTYIRGLESITAPLMIISQRQKKQAAYGTVQDVIRTLPLNFGGIVNEDYSLNQNYSKGSGLNLRGLGTGATLVLVNGRRQPASGIMGDFVDVSTIPWSAVERVDVLTDGSSALYGSDAIAGVVNVIMRQELPGIAETQSRLGSALGGAGERLLSQSFGHRWDDGKWMFTYQYSERTALAAIERSYAADADKRPLGGSNLRSIFTNPGNILSPTTRLPAFAIPNGQDGRSLSPEDLLSDTTHFYNQMAQKDLLPDREAHSAFFTGSRKLGDRFDLFTEGRYNLNQISAMERGFTRILTVPASNPFFIDPFGAPSVLVAYNFLDDLGPIHFNGETTTYASTIGMHAAIDHQWRATLSGSYGKERMNWRGYNLVDSFAINTVLADPNPATAFNPFGSGSNTNPSTLDAIRFSQLEHAVSEIDNINLIVDGSLPDLPAGTPKLAVGLDQRRERLFRYEFLGRTFSTLGRYERKVSAAFAELSVPITAKINLSLMARHETYSDFGHTFNPKLGLRWAVSESLRFRGSFGTSFRAPTLVDLYDKSNDAVALFPLADPQSPTGFSPVLLEQGNNPGLKEEKAKTWTVGADFAPASAPGFTASMSFFAAHYKNRIFRFPIILPLKTMLTDEAWSPLVVRNPPRSEVERLCTSPVFLGSSRDCLASTPAAILDVRFHNLSTTRAQGIDAEIRQDVQTKHGSFNLELNSSYALNFKQAVTRFAPEFDIIGTAFNPPRLRLRSVAGWSQHGPNQPGWTASVITNYVSRFQDEDSLHVPRVGESVTFDAQMTYRTTKSDGWLGDIELTLNGVNIFNQEPPFLDREHGYDFTNAKPYGRVVSAFIQKTW